MRPASLGAAPTSLNALHGSPPATPRATSDAQPDRLSLPPPSHRPGKLAQLADELMKDIDEQMRSLPATEQRKLKPQVRVLLDASAALVDRDPHGNQGSDSPGKCRQALKALKSLRAPALPAAPSARQTIRHASSPQYRMLKQTMRQLAGHIGHELEATLRAARRFSPPKPALAVNTSLSVAEIRQRILAPDMVEKNFEGAGFPKKLGQPVMEILNFLHLDKEMRGENWMTPGTNARLVENLREQHAMLCSALDKLTAAELEAIPEPMRDTLKNLINHATSRAESMQLQLDVHDDYQSPDSIANICHARQLEIDAALHVLRSQANAAQHEPLIRSLENRLHRLDLLKLAPGDADAGRLMGKKPVSGFSRLLHPITARRQALQLEQAGKRWLSAAGNKPVGTRRIGLELGGISEPMFLEWLLKKSGIDDAGKALRAAHRRVLDSSPFDVIRSEIAVPAPGEAAPQVVKAITTPASHVLCDASRIRLADDNPVLNPSNAAQYLHRDAQGNEVRGGFNSHDTAEIVHPTLAAHDELSLHGTTLFGATRHGVASPYALAEELRALPDAEAMARVRSLLGSPTRPPTRMTMAWQGNQPLPLPPTAKGNTIQNAIVSEFKSLLQSKIDRQNQLVTALTETGINGGMIESALAGLSAEDLMNRPEHTALLLDLVRKHPDLTGLLVRQAALNRTRELVILEIARDPRHGDKLATGEPIVMTSISLLTPDALRHAVSGMTGSASHDERAMLDVQLQAWKDLQQEVNDGGIEINGHVLKATFCPFNFGVNDMALLGPGSNPVVGEAISGHDFSNQRCNEASLAALVGLPDDHGQGFTNNATDAAILRLQAKLDALPSMGVMANVDRDRERLERDLKVMRELQAHIRQMWENGSYRQAGNEPYKMASRIALLSFLIEGGTLFNCKSGKVRTGQLSVEVKFLALRIESRHGDVPQPDEELTPLEHVQYGCLLFYDKARTRMQKYATGYEGSKLSYAKKAFAYFSQAFRQLPTNERMRMIEFQVREFIGLSSRTKF